MKGEAQFFDRSFFDGNQYGNRNIAPKRQMVFWGDILSSGGTSVRCILGKIAWEIHSQTPENLCQQADRRARGSDPDDDASRTCGHGHSLHLLLPEHTVHGTNCGTVDAGPQDPLKGIQNRPKVYNDF